MRHDHVPVRAGALVEAGAFVDGQGLGNIDLYMVDVVPVPDRFEHAVREAQRDQILHRLAAEEMVDTKNSILRQHAVNHFVELAGSP